MRILFLFTSGTPGFNISLYNTLRSFSALKRYTGHVFWGPQCVQKILLFFFKILWRNVSLLSTLCHVCGGKALIWCCCVLYNHSQSGWAIPPEVYDNILSSSWTNYFRLACAFCRVLPALLPKGQAVLLCLWRNGLRCNGTPVWDLALEAIWKPLEGAGHWLMWCSLSPTLH